MEGERVSELEQFGVLSKKRQLQKAWDNESSATYSGTVLGFGNWSSSPQGTLVV